VRDHRRHGAPVRRHLAAGRNCGGVAQGRVPASLAGTSVSATWTADVLSLVADWSNPTVVRYQDLEHIRLG
jgi:hypothetical protein